MMKDTQMKKENKGILQLCKSMNSNSQYQMLSLSSLLPSAVVEVLLSPGTTITTSHVCNRQP